MRKRPKQERSRKLVAMILDATASAVAQNGLDAVTTNHVSQLAGISQGSLYQYFESKEDLLEALLERVADDFSRLFDAAVARNDSTISYVEMLGFIRLGANFLHSNDRLYMELLRNWHLLPTQGLVETMQKRILEAVQLYLLRFSPSRPIPDLPERLFICFNSILFTVVRMYSQEKPMVREEWVLQGLARMVTDFLEDVLTPAK